MWIDFLFSFCPPCYVYITIRHLMTCTWSCLLLIYPLICCLNARLSMHTCTRIYCIYSLVVYCTMRIWTRCTEVVLVLAQPYSICRPYKFKMVILSLHIHEKYILPVYAEKRCCNRPLLTLQKIRHT